MSTSGCIGPARATWPPSSHSELVLVREEKPWIGRVYLVHKPLVYWRNAEIVWGPGYMGASRGTRRTVPVRIEDCYALEIL